MFSVLNKIETELKGDKTAWATHYIEMGLAGMGIINLIILIALETILKESRGKYSVGD
jgi:hypothetical protein